MAYIELHCHSHYSLLDGASSPAELMQMAAEQDMPALALTDHDNVYGAVEFAQAAQGYGVKPIFGAEMTLSDGHHLTLLVRDVQGWSNLCHLITHSQSKAPKGEACLPVDILADHSAELIALTGCSQGAVTSALRRRQLKHAIQAAEHYRDIFGGDNVCIELQHHLLPEDDALIAAQVDLAHRLRLPYVATNNVHYASREGQRLQDILVCIRHGRRLETTEALLRPNDEYYLKNDSDMQSLFRVYPEALAMTVQIADRCTFQLDRSLQALPTYPAPYGTGSAAYLRQLCMES